MQRGKSQKLGSYPSWSWSYQAGSHSKGIMLFSWKEKKKEKDLNEFGSCCSKCPTFLASFSFVM